MRTVEANVDRLSFEKVFQFPEHLDALVHGEEAYPINVQIGPVNYCNHNCTFCYAARSKFDAQGTPRTRIDLERLLQIIEEMHGLGLRSATLVGSGEPTLHPQIDEMISGIAVRGVDVGLFTNGSCVTDTTAQAIANHATFVRFSLTGATREIHDLVHGNGDFDTIIKNIEKIVKTRRASFPTLGSQFVLTSYSAPDVVKGALLARSLGLDYYEVKSCYVAPDKPDQLENALSIEEANALIEEAEACATEAFQVYGKADQMQAVLKNVDDRCYDDCPGHKTTAVLEADLNLYICVNQKVPECCFGDVKDQSFREVWQGERRREVLKCLDVHKCVPRCRQDPLNRIVHEIRVGERFVPTDMPKLDLQLHPSFL